MKILLFSDLHVDTAAAQRIVERAATVDLLIGAGDFASARRGLQRCIDVLRAIERPTILVAGNNETTDELREACRHWTAAHILQGTSVTLQGQTFYGVGGGIPVTPFGAWSYDFSEEQAADLLADCPENCVLVVHSPPQGAVDLNEGRHLGSSSIRRTIEQVQPRLVVCGHIHACAGQQTQIGASPVINAGPTGMEWELTPSQM
jgi:Icc-related predicted phosphoesterase